MLSPFAVYFLKRFFAVIPTMWLVVTLVFFFLRLIPGDPVDFMLGENAEPADRARLIQAYHFNEPLPFQYLSYLQDVVTGRLGESYNTGLDVSSNLWRRYCNTLELGGVSILWAILFSLPMGIVAAVKKGTATDRLLSFFSLFGISMPTFYLGPLLALVFAVWLDWLPVSGRDLPGSVILPSLTLGLAMAALLTRFTRASLIEVLGKDYVRTARAKGLHPFVVVVKHGFRTALIPVVSILGLQLGALLTGTVVTEKVFSWPGIGSLLLDSISKREYALVQGASLLIAATYVVVNFFTDLVSAIADPRFGLTREVS